MGLKLKGPTPNRTPRTVPVVNNQGTVVQTLKKWQQVINQSLTQPQTPAGVLNFKVTPQAGGNQLSWAETPGSDGYVLYKSLTPDFSKNVTSIPLNNAKYITHFDSVGTDAPPPTIYYKIASTNGTISKPNSRVGAPTPIQSGSPTAVATAATITSMITTSSISFSQITTGENDTGTLTVGSGGSIVATGTGIIDATEINGSGTLGSNNEIFATPADGSSGFASLRVAVVNDYKFHDEVLTDGASNIIYAGGDVVMVVGVPN